MVYKLVRIINKYNHLRNWFTLKESIMMVLSPLMGCRGRKFYHEKILAYLSENYYDVVKKWRDYEPNLEGKDWLSNLTIYVMWYQGYEKMPNIVKACYNSILQYRGNHEVVLLHSGNLNEYVSLPEEIMTKFDNGLISYAHYSDIVRSDILSRGGIWMDATLLMVEELKLPNLSFYTIKRKKEENYRFVSEQKWTSFFMAADSCCVVNKFVRDLLFEYNINEDKLIDYFLIDYALEFAYRTCPLAKLTIDGVTYNNPDIHFISSHLNDSYDEHTFSIMCQETNLFKLSYRTKINENLNNTYYKYVMSFIN